MNRHIEADTISEGWLQALEVGHAAQGGKLVHLVVRILHPPKEVPEIRTAAQDLIDRRNGRTQPRNHYYDIETTRNTIFPSAWARRYPEPADLATYYRARYTKDGLRSFRANWRGTYFGRIVAYPRGTAEPGNQLADTVRKLRAEVATRAPKSSRYEINIYNEACDKNPMSFPCLAHLSLHLHEGALHMQAIYRNESLISRAYGNFLGLGQLLEYVAAATGIATGELLVTAGHVELEGQRTEVREILSRFQ